MEESISTVSIEEKNYPRLLRKIKEAPSLLYFRGKMVANEKCFAIVGTRKCSNYGKEVALQIAQDLIEAGLTLVSGFAPGIDTIVHRLAVENKKRTIAVLGTGLNEKFIYPKSNLKLAKEILEFEGCLISEYPPKTPGARFTFPKRNRIISGLSLGVLVVEAPEKSGSLITAEYAFFQKRKVFAVPGSIFSKNSKGCHYLIKRGAKLVESAKDILDELKIKKDFSKNLIVGENKEENLILDALKNGALDVEKIIEKTGLSAQTVVTLLSILEIKGKIKNLGANIYAISNR